MGRALLTAEISFHESLRDVLLFQILKVYAVSNRQVTDRKPAFFFNILVVVWFRGCVDFQ